MCHTNSRVNTLTCAKVRVALPENDRPIRLSQYSAHESLKASPGRLCNVVYSSNDIEEETRNEASRGRYAFGMRASRLAMGDG